MDVLVSQALSLSVENIQRLIRSSIRLPLVLGLAVRLAGRYLDRIYEPYLNE